MKGSLREAIEAKGPRVVVFNLSGTIHLKRWLVVSEPYSPSRDKLRPAMGSALQMTRRLS